jgi:hypothetical protein
MCQGYIHQTSTDSQSALECQVHRISVTPQPCCHSLAAHPQLLNHVCRTLLRKHSSTPLPKLLPPTLLSKT